MRVSNHVLLLFIIYFLKLIIIVGSTQTLYSSSQLNSLLVLWSILLVVKVMCIASDGDINEIDVRCQLECSVFGTYLQFLYMVLTE